MVVRVVLGTALELLLYDVDVDVDVDPGELDLVRVRHAEQLAAAAALHLEERPLGVAQHAAVYVAPLVEGHSGPARVAGLLHAPPHEDAVVPVGEDRPLVLAGGKALLDALHP